MSTETKTKSQLEYLFDQTMIAKKQFHCFGCGVAYPAGTRMLRMGAVKRIGHEAKHVCLRFCRICREIGRDLTAPEWRDLQKGQIRHGHKEEWLKLHREYNPSEEA